MNAPIDTTWSGIRDSLLAKRFTLEQIPEGHSGIYGFFMSDPNALPHIAVPMRHEFGDGILYVGMTRPGEKGNARDHVECDHSGRSTLRRSIGALLQNELQPRLSPMRRAPGDSAQNWRCYRFQGQGELALTQWMMTHLRMNFVPLEADRDIVRECEQNLIKELSPPLNLTDWDNRQRKMIKAFRARCAKEARSQLPNSGHGKNGKTLR